MSRLNTETFDFKFRRQNLAPGSGHPTWGGEASGPSGGTARACIRGSWGQIPGCRRSAQLLTASPRLQTSEGISKRWYICVVSKQTLRELPTPAGAYAPASPGSALCGLDPRVWPGCGDSWPYRKRSRSRRQTGAGNLLGGESGGGCSRIRSVQGSPAGSPGAGLSRLLSVRTVVGLRSESRGRKEKRHRPQARVGARSTSRL